jgi:MIP family channel proteins
LSPSSRKENTVEDRGPSAYVAEFLGTFLLVLFITLILAVNSQAGLGFTDFAVIGLLHAFVLMMLIASLGGASGAHFNPAVTTTLAVLRKIKPSDAAIYIVVQLAGGVAAALVTKLLLLDEGQAGHYGATTVSDMLSGKTGAGFLAELIGTFVLMWAIMGTAVNPRADRSWAPWVIGATLGFAVMTLGPLTGAGFNPARSFGPALVGGAFDGAGTFVVVYVLGPVIGALLAGLAYSAVVLGPQERGLGGQLSEDVAALATPGKRPIDALS